MHIKQIEFLKDGMNDSYYELIESIENFIENPTKGNKKNVKEKMKNFNSLKNSLSHYISDFWCKGE